MSKKGMSRRDFIKTAGVIGGVVAGGLVARQIHYTLGRDFRPSRAEAYLAGLSPGLTSKDLPNIIIILCDDLGKGDLATPALTLPNLKRMAAEGMTLNNFYASASVCSPSRAGLLTGRYPVRTLIPTPIMTPNNPLNIVMDVLGRYSYNVQGIPQDEVLLPEALKAQGYRTGMVGKWHLGATPGHIPPDRGFDSYYGALWSNDDHPYAIYRNRTMEIPNLTDQDNLTHDLTVEAVKFIRTSKDGPFFLYFAHPMPHYPQHASAAFQGKSGAGLYGDAVEEIDWSVGQLLGVLKELGLDEKTAIFFSSDNGPWMQGNPGYQRGRKLTWFEGGFHVPGLARYPGVIPPGSVSDAVAVNFDLLPTCLAMAGIPLPQDRIYDGQNLLPVLKGEAASLHESFVYYDVRGATAIRQGNWKYVRRHMTDIGPYFPTQQGPFLFNLENDPNESYSLFEQETSRAESMADALDAFERGMKVNLRGWL